MRAGGASAAQLALNDVVLLRRETGRMLDFETRSTAATSTRHGGDGLVVATRHRLHRLCPVLRRPDRRPAPRRAGDGADLPAHAVRPPDRGAGRRTIEVRSHERRDRRAPRSPATARCSATCSPATGWRSRAGRARSRCCIRPATTTSGCCAPSCTGAAAATHHGALGAPAMLRHLQIRDFAIIDARRARLRAAALPCSPAKPAPASPSWSTRWSCSAGGRAGAEVVRAGAERAEVTATLRHLPAPARAARPARGAVHRRTRTNCCCAG